MKVKQLIAKLKKFDPDKEVIVTGLYNSDADIDAVVKDKNYKNKVILQTSLFTG